MRQTRLVSSTRIQVREDIWLDLDRKEVQSTTGITRLTAREYQIVCFLLQHTNTGSSEEDG